MRGQGAHRTCLAAPGGTGVAGVCLQNGKECRADLEPQFLERRSAGEGQQCVANVVARDAAEVVAAAADIVGEGVVRRILGRGKIVARDRDVKRVTRKSGNVEHLGELR